jgi:hypothetical protein
LLGKKPCLAKTPVLVSFWDGLNPYRSRDVTCNSPFFSI